jgi:hypothetical protein
LQKANPICGPPRRIVAAVLALLLAAPAAAQWVTFEDHTASRVSADANLVANDPDEKDYAWGDVDRDGDTDLVVVRKEEATSPGKRTNVLLMNMSGVLTDRTSEFATASDVPGDNGFLTPTNDRDVVLADLNNDGWLDMVTTTAISNGDPQHIGYPRVYMNRCCSIGGCAVNACSTEDWLGFRYEFDRIPEMLSDSGQAGFNPCFCAVAAGDVTGDGYDDLYFVDYDTSCGGSGSPQDFNDKLLINEGASNPGFFVDSTETNFVSGATGFPESAFGASGAIDTFNEDSRPDILKQFASNVDLGFNSTTEGIFDSQTQPYGGSAYFVSHGDLNNDDKLDLIVSDDGQDRYVLNQGDGGDGVADFISFAFGYQHSGVGGPSSDDGFSGNSIVADLDKDGWNDAVITDVDVDVPGCSRRTHIFRNLGGEPGDSVIMREETSGTNCPEFMGNPPECIVASIPSNLLEGTHDVAIFDLNGDSYLDMIVGRCAGTQVYLNVPDLLPGGGVPNGDDVPGPMLTMSRHDGQYALHWGASCAGTDNDYVVYRGDIGDYDSHAAVTCSTLGATTMTVGNGFATNGYYLVAPRNDEAMGSLGDDSQGAPRGTGEGACLPQVAGECSP